MTLLPDHIYGVILAGGSGTRFWPKSRHKTPKQLCAIGNNDKTMIEVNLGRLNKLIPPERRIVVTHKDQVELSKQICGEQVGTWLAEPEARNTSAALAMASIEIQNQYNGNKKPVMISLHADAIISNETQFEETLRSAIAPAESGYLTLLGIVPDCAETGYGYIEKGTPLSTPDVRSVASFREKPDFETAETYLKSGNFLWNSGIFVWQTQSILGELEKRLPIIPQLIQGLLTEGIKSLNEVNLKDLTTVWKQIPKIAIDNAVLEVSENVAVIAADIGWKDVGSWNALSECFETDHDGNLTYGQGWMLDCKNTTVDSDGPFVATIGLSDMVVVSAKNAILVCPKHRSQEVKKVVEHLKKSEQHELL